MRPDQRGVHGNRLWEFCFLDHKARWRANLWIGLLTFGYGVFNSVILARPERQVSFEAFILVCFGTIVSSILYAPSAGSDFSTATSSRNGWFAFSWFGNSMPIRVAAVTAALFILVSNAVPLNAIEPAVAVWRLQKSSIGIIPGPSANLQDSPPATRFRQVTESIDGLLTSGKPMDPGTIGTVRNKLQDTVESIRLPADVREAAVQEIVHLQAYENFSSITRSPEKTVLNLTGPQNVPVPPLPLGPIQIIGAGEDLSSFVAAPSLGTLFIVERPMFFTRLTIRGVSPEAGPQKTQFVALQGKDANVVAYKVTVDGLRQEIGGITWLNVTFKNCVVMYSGQPIYLGSVRFVHCRYEFGSDANSQQLFKVISEHSAEPVTFFASSSSK